MAAIPIKRTTGEVISSMDDVERMLDAWPSASLHSVRDGMWHPTMDVYRKTEEMVIELELPGLTFNEIDISVEEDHLFIEGTRERSKSHSEDDQFYSERAFGRFHRVIHMPESIEANDAKAALDNGILTITLPIKRRGGTKIEIAHKE